MIARKFELQLIYMEFGETLHSFKADDILVDLYFFQDMLESSMKDGNYSKGYAEPLLEKVNNFILIAKNELEREDDE